MLCRHGKQDWCGDPPECAFDENGNFTSDNWNCFLMNALRRLLDPMAVENFPYGTYFWDEDENTGVIYIPDPDFEGGELRGALVILKWYKSRGRTDSFQIVKGDKVRNGTEKDALFIAKLFQKYHKMKIRGLETDVKEEKSEDQEKNSKMEEWRRTVEMARKELEWAKRERERLMEIEWCDGTDNLWFDDLTKVIEAAEEIINTPPPVEEYAKETQEDT